MLEDPETEPPRDMWKLTRDARDAPDEPEDFVLHFQGGLPSKLEVEGGKSATDPVDLFLLANDIARKHGIGRIDIVENRFIGLKSRGCYETPGLTMLRAAHVDLEGLTLDREVRALRDALVTVPYSRVLYNGLYFSPEREYLHKCLMASQGSVTGHVRCRAYKGAMYVVGRGTTPEIMRTVYDESESSMDEIGEGFRPEDAGGFIGVESIRLRKFGKGLQMGVGK